MKHKLLLLFFLPAIALLSAQQAMALRVELDLGPHGTYLDRNYEFSSLNGMSLSGQSISLDFSFQDDFLRVYSITDLQGFMVGLTIRTNVAGFPGFLGEASTAYLLNERGKPYGEITGGGMVDDGRMFIGLFPFLETESGDLKNAHVPIDFYGAHFDLVFPELSGAQITSSNFHVFVPESRGAGMSHYDAVFGIGSEIPKNIKIPGVPDTGSTLAMLGMALCTLGRNRPPR
jgi:hypothetical protein